MKIAIGMHISDAIMPAIYFNHISAISAWAKKYEVVIVGTWREKVARARNQIVDGAVKEGCSHLLLIDSDHLLPDNLLEMLVENSDAVAVSGLICKRYYPYDEVVFKCTPDGELQQCLIKTRDKVLEVDACAMGCTLINLDIVSRLLREEKVTAPLFHDRGKFRSDINFFLEMRRLGERVLLDTRVEVGHLGDPIIITPKNAQLMRENYLIMKSQSDGKNEDSN